MILASYSASSQPHLILILTSSLTSTSISSFGLSFCAYDWFKLGQEDQEEAEISTMTLDCGCTSEFCEIRYTKTVMEYFYIFAS